MIRERTLGQYLQMNTKWVFSLCHRIQIKNSKVTAYKILSTYQAIEEIPAGLSIIATLIGIFFLNFSLWEIPVTFICAELIGLLIIRSGLIFLLQHFGILQIGYLWASIPPIPFHLITMIVLGIVFNVQMAAMWLIGYIGSIVINTFLEFLVTVFRSIPLTASGANFIIAYKIFAKRNKVSPNPLLSEEELESNDWEKCFDEFINKHPMSAANFIF